MEYVLHEDYGELKQAHDDDAGYDLYATEHVRIPVRGRKLVQTAVSVAIDPNHVGFVCSRSGLALKHGVVVLNAPGVIDSGYRGRVGVILANLGDEPYDVVPQDRVAQLVILPLNLRAMFEVDELSIAERGKDGFGSTGYNELH